MSSVSSPSSCHRFIAPFGLPSPHPLPLQALHGISLIIILSPSNLSIFALFLWINQFNLVYLQLSALACRLGACCPPVRSCPQYFLRIFLLNILKYFFLIFSFYFFFFPIVGLAIFHPSLKNSHGKILNGKFPLWRELNDRSQNVATMTSAAKLLF